MNIIANRSGCIHYHTTLDRVKLSEKLTVTRSHESIQSNHFHSRIKPSILSKKEEDKERALTNVQKATKLNGQSLGETVDTLIETITAGYPTKNVHSRQIKDWEGDHIIGHGNWEGDTRNFESLLISRSKGSQNKNDHIKYGSLSFRPHEGYKCYGNSSIYFHEEIKENMTFTPGDSLRIYKRTRPDNFTDYPFAVDGNLYPIIENMNFNYLSRKTVLSWNDAFGNFCGGSTVEWQYHGPLPFEHIEYICFSADTPEYHLDKVNDIFKNLDRLKS